MRHDPSTYIGIGEDGFRGPDHYEPFYDEPEGEQRTRVVVRQSTLFPVMAVLFSVMGMLGYFFFGS